jgi:D-alanyl-D-alanine carboxypeptidase
LTSAQFNRSKKKTHRVHQWLYWQQLHGRSFRVIFTFFKIRRYRKRISKIHASLGIAGTAAETSSMPVQMEAGGLVSIGPDIYQREQRMIPGAAKAWCSMVESAASDQVVLQAVSAFRSLDYQAGIIRRKLESGQCIRDILCVSAAPGYSEHHTGRAIDITTPGFAVLEEEFEQSEAFSWLNQHAGRFGFSLSFPRGNPFGVIYEPWHWAWKDPGKPG